MTRSTLAVLVLTLLAACSSSSSNPVPNPLAIDRSPRLTQVTSCSQLENAIEDALVLDMKSSIEQIRKSGGVYIGPLGVPTASGPGRPLAAGPAAAGPTSVSTTNT